MSTRSSITNTEGNDFLLNWWTHRVTCDEGPVTSSYVRFSDEELFTEEAIDLMNGVNRGVEIANTMYRVLHGAA